MKCVRCAKNPSTTLIEHEDGSVEPLCEICLLDIDPRLEELKGCSPLKVDFVFLDGQGRAFRVKTWEDEVWLFRYGPDKNWVSMRPVKSAEIDHYSAFALPPSKAALYGI